MSHRSGVLAPPMADRPNSTKQTGAYVLRSLTRPIVIVIIVGMFIAYYGITGVTTALRHLDAARLERQERKHIRVYENDGATYLPRVKAFCEDETHAYDKCFPMYDQRKRVRRCKHRIRELEDCAYEVHKAEKVCLESNPENAGPEVSRCMSQLLDN